MRKADMVVLISILISTAALLIAAKPFSLWLISGSLTDATQMLVSDSNSSEATAGIGSRPTFETAERDYFYDPPEGRYFRNSRLFVNYRGVVVESPPAVEAPANPPSTIRRSTELSYVGKVNRNGTDAWSFRSESIDTAGIFTLGSTWRGWTLVDVKNDNFIFEFDGKQYIIPR
jgi:hypothetical protein